jgi:hypothetical protein
MQLAYISAAASRGCASRALMHVAFAHARYEHTTLRHPWSHQLVVSDRKQILGTMIRTVSIFLGILIFVVAWGQAEGRSRKIHPNVWSDASLLRLAGARPVHQTQLDPQTAITIPTNFRCTTSPPFFNN